MDAQKVTAFLLQWIVDYVKHRDIYTKSIETVDTSNNLVKVKHKTKLHWYVVLPELNPETVHEILKTYTDDYTSLVTLNLRQNLETLIQHWKEFVKYEKFNIYFVNPFSSTDKRWIISPHVHNKICDEKALKTGLESIFLTVDEVTNGAVEKMEKSIVSE